MRSQKITDIDEYRVKKRTTEDIILESHDPTYISDRFDQLEDLISSSHDILRAKKKERRDILRISSLLVATLIMGVSFTLSVFSYVGYIDIGWQFFASIFFASGGISAASFLILIGVDSEQY